MKYGEIKEYDIANGPGVRLSLFVSGCTHHCKGCFNPMTWDFDYGMDYTQETEDKIVELLGESCYEGITLLGGEPMELVNQKPFCRCSDGFGRRIPIRISGALQAICTIVIF